MKLLCLFAIFGSLSVGQYLISADSIGTFGTVGTGGRLEVGTVDRSVWVQKIEPRMRIDHPVRISEPVRLP